MHYDVDILDPEGVEGAKACPDIAGVGGVLEEKPRVPRALVQDLVDALASAQLDEGSERVDRLLHQLRS